ncbi:MAG: esterase/lipase family protein [Bacillus sp. (in: firmicutes)]
MKNRVKKRFLVICLGLLLIIPYSLPSKAVAGKLKPPGETFTPGQWFLGDRPPNLDPAKPPIVFVQGKNGSSTSWYGETTYHGLNDMYTKAYEAGYQTVFVQLYDAAGNGSETQYRNGQLLASMLADISRHFNGKKVNIIAHSKGGPDTQAALIHYGAHQYAGRVITLGSPHRGSELADLAYSWYAGWLGQLLGQNDAGTYSLQVGEMARFRSATDSHTNRSKNKYYTVAGTNRGPAFSALALGGAYLGSYGNNDGLVTESSSKLPYGQHLFTDSSIDHDNIRKGSKVFSRIEPYLRSASISQITSASDTSMQAEEVIRSTSSHYIHGDSLAQHSFLKQDIYIPEKTTGTITVYTASPSTTIELVAPDGTTIAAGQPKPDHMIFSGAYTYTFSMPDFSPGTWTVRMKATDADDAYLLAASFNEKNSYKLEMPGTGKAGQTGFTIRTPKQAGSTSFSIKIIDSDGNELKQNIQPATSNGTDFTATLPNVSKPGVYNVTIDVITKHSSGEETKRTMVRSIYLE